MAKSRKWLNLSKDNASLSTVMVKGKQAIMLSGHLSGQQIKELEAFGFRPIPFPTATVLATIKYTDRNTFKLKVNEIPFEDIAKAFPNGVVENMELSQLSKMWSGYNVSTASAIASTANSERTARALETCESIGLNHEGVEIFLTNDDQRFYRDGEYLMFSRDGQSADFLAYIWPTHTEQAAKALLAEMLDGRIVNQNRLDQIIETSGENIRVTSKQAAEIQTNVVEQIQSLVLNDMRSSYNKGQVDLELLTKINDNVGALPSSDRDDTYIKPLSPAYSFIARSFLEAIDNCESLTLVNDKTVALSTLIPNELPLRFAKRSDSRRKFSFSKAFQKEFGQVPTVNMDVGTQSITPGSQILLDAESGELAEPIDMFGLTITRKDHQQAIATLTSMNQDAQALLVVDADDGYNLGTVDMDSFSIHNYIYQNYNVVDATDIAPIINGSNQPKSAKRVYMVNGRKPIPSSTNAPTEINALYSLSDVYQYATTLKEKFDSSSAITLRKDVDLKTSTSISDILANYTANQTDAAKYDLNFAQSRYTPLTSLAKANDMAAMPTNFVYASREAVVKLIKDVGNPDQFLMNELDMTEDEITEVWDAEQIDAITMGIWRLKNGKPFLQGDATGKGKGRTLAAFMYWSVKQGRTPVFMTSTNDLLSDIYRDIKDTKLDRMISPFFLMSDGTDITDKKFNNILFDSKTLKSTKDHYLKSNSKFINETAILTTYSQLNSLEPKRNRNQSLFERLNERAKWLSEFAERNNVQFIFDESHNIASTTSNRSLVIDHLMTKTSNPTVRSSATWSKDANNIAQCSDLFPNAYNAETLRKMISIGGTQLQEVLSTVLIAEGAMVRREHNFGQRRVDIIESQQSQRNRIATNAMAEIMQKARAYASRQFEIIKTLSEFQVKHKNIEEYSFASNFGLISEGFTNAMRAEQVAIAAKSAVMSNQKPIIGVDKTAETALRYLYEGLLEAGLGDEDNRVMIDNFPDFQTMLHRWIVNEGTRKIKVITQPSPDEIREAAAKGETAKPHTDMVKVHWRDSVSAGTTEYEELEKMEKELLQLTQKMPSLPLSPIDYVKTELNKAGVSIAEVSGRSLHVVENVSGHGYVIETRPKETKAQAQFEFNSNQKDAILLTRSGTEGISLHAQAEFSSYPGATNKRHIMLMGSFFYVVDEEQFFGRGERKGQVATSMSSKVVTGMPIEARMLALSERNRLRLSASTTGKSESLRSTSTVPNIMNKFGNEVMAEYLSDNPHILDLLGFEDGAKNNLLAFGTEKFKNNQIASLSGSVLGRMMLLDYEQQNALLDEITQFYNAQLSALQAKGIDPINTKTITGDISVTKSDVLTGTVQTHYKSEFDKPVLVQDIVINHEPIKINAEVIESDIVEGQRKLDIAVGKKGAKLADLTLILMQERPAILERKLIEHNQRQLALASSFARGRGKINTYDTVEEAISASDMNRVKAADKSFKRLVEFMNNVDIGQIIEFGNSETIVTGLNIPKEKSALLEDWKYQVVSTNTYGEQGRNESLDSFLFQIPSMQDLPSMSRGIYNIDHPINEKLTDLKLKGRVERTTILMGNIIEAARLNAEKRMGTQVVIKDATTNTFYPAIRARKDLDLHAVMSLNFNASTEANQVLVDYVSSDLARDLMIVFEHDSSTSKDGEAKQGVIFLGAKDNGFSVVLPRTKANRYQLAVPVPFDDLEFDKSGFNNRSKLHSRYEFDTTHLPFVLERLNESGFYIQLSASMIDGMQHRVKECNTPKAQNDHFIEDALVASENQADAVTNNHIAEEESQANVEATEVVQNELAESTSEMDTTFEGAHDIEPFETVQQHSSSVDVDDIDAAIALFSSNKEVESAIHDHSNLVTKTPPKAVENSTASTDDLDTLSSLMGGSSPQTDELEVQSDILSEVRQANREYHAINSTEISMNNDNSSNESLLNELNNGAEEDITHLFSAPTP